MSWIKLQSEYDDLDKYQFDDGNIIYCKKGSYIKHNPYGPAFISKYGNKIYWINDGWLLKEEFEVHSERLKILGKEYLICLK